MHAFRSAWLYAESSRTTWAIEGDLCQNNINNSRSQKIPAKVSPPQTKHKQAKRLSHGGREGEQLWLEPRKSKAGGGMVTQTE